MDRVGCLSMSFRHLSFVAGAAPAFARDRRGSEHGDHTGPGRTHSGKIQQIQFIWVAIFIITLLALLLEVIEVLLPQTLSSRPGKTAHVSVWSH